MEMSNATKEFEFFQKMLEAPLTKLDRFAQDEFEEALLHFGIALHADRVFFLRTYCAKYPSETPVDLKLEPCPTCGSDHVALGALDSCLLTVVTAGLLQELLRRVEELFQEHWPIVFPTFVEELRAMQRRLGKLQELDGDG